MGSLNLVVLVGNLGGDPELKSLETGAKVCNFTVATNEVFKDKAGNKQERVEWSRVTVWGNQAESCAKYLSKGRTVVVVGRKQTREYEKDGVKQRAVDIIADRVVFVGNGKAETMAAPDDDGGDV